MKKMLSVLIVLAFVTTCSQAQNKIIGEKGSEGVIGEKSSERVIGEKSRGDAEIAKSNNEIESAFADYIQQKAEMEKSLADLRINIETGIRLLEKNKRFRSPKQGIRLRNTWKEALKLQEKANGEIKVVKSSVVAPDMIR